MLHRFGRLLRACAGALAPLLFAAAALAQGAGGSRPITLVVPYAAGGGHDAMARLLAERLTSRLNQTVLVENRPGANGMRVMIELPGPWIEGVRSCDIEDMKKMVFREFGPNVNLANIDIKTIFDTEAQRVGTAGPLSRAAA